MTEILKTLSAYAEAWRRGDLAGLAALYHDDFTLHYPGTHALAGVHRGKPEALRILREVSVRTQRKLEEIVDIMGGQGRGALHVKERWIRAGEEALIERVFVYTVEDATLHACWLFDADQTLVARFLRPL